MGPGSLLHSESWSPKEPAVHAFEHGRGGRLLCLQAALHHALCDGAHSPARGSCPHLTLQRKGRAERRGLRRKPGGGREGLFLCCQTSPPPPDCAPAPHVHTTQTHTHTRQHLHKTSHLTFPENLTRHRRDVQGPLWRPR